MKVYLKKNVEKLKEIDWVSELIKTAGVFVISIFFLFGIRKLSPGEYDGIKLQNYLQKEIVKAINEKNMYITMSEIPYRGEYDTLSESEILLMYCEYKLPTQEEGRVISLFEREKENIWHKLFGIKPSYSISFIRKCSIAGMPSETFYYTGVDVRDIDSDGKNDIFISLQSNMATRISHIEIPVSKIKNEWKIITPSLELMEQIEKEAEKEKYRIYYDKYELIDPYNSLQNSIVYGLSQEGMTYILKNPLSGGVDICFEIAANDQSGDSSTNTNYAYAMMKLKDGRLERDENWNGGNLLILDKTIDFLEVKDLYWGYIKTDNLQFYSGFRE